MIDHSSYKNKINRSLYLSVRVFRTVVLIVDTVNKQTNVTNRGVEFGTTEDKSIQWQGAGFEPGTSGLQVQRPSH